MKLFRLVALALPGCALAFAALASLSSARADVIYSTFGPGDSYGPACAPSCGYAVVVGGPTLAVPFTIGSTDMQFDSFTIALSNGSETMNFALMSAKDGAPDAVLETFAFNGTGWPGLTGPVTTNSVLHPVLEAGQTYFIAAPCCQYDGYYTWSFNALGVTGFIAGYPWSGYSEQAGLQPVVRVEGTPQATKAPVPEPATWAMMMAGLGFAGVTHRRKQRIAACN